jgi:hypothetical protein
MGQVSWRSSDELVERVRHAASVHGTSMNEFITAVLDVATDPERAVSDGARVRERLSQAGLLADPTPAVGRPSRRALAAASQRAASGVAVADLVSDAR